MSIGVVSIVGAIVIGEMYISHSRGDEISSEVMTLIKMSLTGMLSIISYYIGKRNQAKEDEGVVE